MKWYIQHAGSVVFTKLPAWVYFFESVIDGKGQLIDLCGAKIVKYFGLSK